MGALARDRGNVGNTQIARSVRIWSRAGASGAKDAAVGEAMRSTARGATTGARRRDEIVANFHQQAASRTVAALGPAV